jgi:hypothetical protein
MWTSLTACWGQQMAVQPVTACKTDIEGVTAVAQKLHFAAG